MLPSLNFNVRDATGFSVRKVTPNDKKRYKNASMSQMLSVQGSGTMLGEVPVNYGTAEKIEAWCRARPDFGASVSASTGSTDSTTNSASLADELAKLANLRDSGVLTPGEFDAQKARLLNS